MGNRIITDPVTAWRGQVTDTHYRELIESSSIDPAVAAERGYTSVYRPTQETGAPIRGLEHNADAWWMSTRDQLKALGFPSWSTREPYYFPGLLIPSFTPRGQKVPGQWKPFRAVPDGKGKTMRYASARGSARLDVHPRWSADRGADDPALVPYIQDPTVPLWITEGVKKADALTSRNVCTVALQGVFNWRNTHATLGDWEDIRLKGREITICFDADAIVKPAVAMAMARLGAWLKHKGAAKVWYLVVPAMVGGQAVKGVDDYFAAGGTLPGLEQAYATKAPKIIDTADKFTDSRLAETLAAEVLDGAYLWVPGLDWLAYDGRVWKERHETSVAEAVRIWALEKFADAAQRMKDETDTAAGADVEGWRPMLGASRQKSVLGLAKGIVERQPEEFDADPDVLNTPDGVVDLRTGVIGPHDPDLLLTKITKGSYRPGYRHEDWDQALVSLATDDVRNWYQVRMGQAITGITTTDGRVLILQGEGNNGKSALTTDGFLHGIGTYGMVASHKLLMGGKNEHSTEVADLRGHRFVVVEELVEDREINVGAMKRIADVSKVRARRTHKDNMEFQASHTLVATSNPIPIVKETDNGTWRRLCMVKFPIRWVDPSKPLEGPADRHGDPTLKRRLVDSPSGQHDAMITWAVEGAMRWYANRERMTQDQETRTKSKDRVSDLLNPPAVVEADTLAWRKLSDRILGFWDECLVVDPSASVVTKELWSHFNAWLQGNGHTGWSLETFGPKFGSHATTAGARVSKKRTRDHSTIVRRPSPSGMFVSPEATEPLKPQVEVWVGVRYRVPADSDL